MSWSRCVSGKASFGVALLFSALIVAGAAFGCKDKGVAVTPVSGTVAVTAGEDGFVPSSVTFKKGEPAKLVFTRTTDKTCATEVVFPELKITKPLPLNTPVAIDIPTTDTRTLTFQCGMGMYKSKVVVQ